MSYSNLLLNVLFIIIPLYVYQIFILDFKKINQAIRNIFVILLLSISIILCLSFPVTISEGFIFDLRHIPLIIGALYGGYFIAIPLYIVTFIYRFIIGGDGLLINFFGITLILIIVPLLRNKFYLMKAKNKILFSTAISMMSALTIVLIGPIFIEISTPTLFIIAANYIFIQGLTIALFTYLVEKMIETLKLQQTIQETEKLQIISQLAASVSHEVRNPLTVTKGFLQLLQSHNISNEKKDEYIVLALSELKRAEEIINDYLAFAKAKPKCFTVNNIGKCVQNAANILGPYAIMHQVQIITATDENCSDLKAKYDCTHFLQCLINIGKNAIEAMPTGGVLKFHICCDGVNHVRINVTDTGMGMSSEEVSNLFSAYYSTKNSGTGLGLSVVKDIIKEMRGNIKVFSKRGEGTTFTISIPLHLE